MHVNCKATQCFITDLQIVKLCAVDDILIYGFASLLQNAC